MGLVKFLKLMTKRRPRFAEELAVVRAKRPRLNTQAKDSFPDEGCIGWTNSGMASLVSPTHSRRIKFCTVSEEMKAAGYPGCHPLVRTCCDSVRAFTPLGRVHQIYWGNAMFNFGTVRDPELPAEA
jgi:hypothetical protein